MFTGIIETVGRIERIERSGGDARMLIDTGNMDRSDIKLGDSIAVSGVCLTVVTLPGRGFRADVSGETLQHTTFGELDPGARVNLEKAVKAGAPLGGHIVSGHVDGVGLVTRFYQDARSWRLHIRVPEALSRYITRKGSVCVDGVSLTVNGVDGPEFDVNIVPHTLQQTTLGDFEVGRRVNLEVDVIARYLERLLAARAGESGGLSETLLRERGFIQ